MDCATGIRFFIRPVLIYLAALAIVRLMGKRALGQLSLFDLVIMAGIGDIIIVVGLEQRVALAKGVLILILFGGMELFMSSLTYRSRFFSRLLEGKPTLLIKDGLTLEKNLAREHISRADLNQELRKQGVARISQVSQATLEACGKFSVILKEDEGVANQQKLQDLLEQSLLEVASLRRELTELKTDLATMKENQTWHSS